MSRQRKFIRVALGIALGVLNLALAAWLLRDAWLLPIARGELETLLREALSADVAIGSISGSLTRDVRIEGVEIRATGTTEVIESIEGARIEAAYDVLALADGDLSGLRGARVTAERIVVRIPAAGDAPPAEPAVEPWPDAAALATWLGALPDGATISADELVVREPGGEDLLAGPLRITVTPRPRRRLSLDAGALTVEVIATADGLFHLDVALADLPGRIRALGTDVPLEGGVAVVELEGDLDDRELRGRMSWTGGRLRDRGPSALSGTVHLRRESLRVELDAVGPGGRIEVRDVALALTDIDDALHAARGSVALDLIDLEPWRSFLPDEVAARLPIRGRLRATLDGGGLAVGRGTLSGRGFAIDVERGRLPFDSGELETAVASLAATVTLDESLAIPVGDDSITVIGEVRGVVEGNLRAPRVTAALSLGPGQAFGHAWDSLSADAALADGTVSVTTLDIRGARPLGAAEAAGAQVLGRTFVRLPAADAPDVVLDVDVAITGPGGTWLDTYARDVDTEHRIGIARLSVVGTARIGDTPLPAGAVEVRIGALEFAGAGEPISGTITGRVSAPTDGLQTFDLGLTGSLDTALLALVAVDTEPLKLEGGVPATARLVGAFGPDGPAGFSATLRIESLELPDSPPAQLDARASFAADGTIAIENLSVLGPLTLSASGSVPPTGSGEPLDLRVTAQLDDTATLARWIPQLPPAGHATIDATIRGTRTRTDGSVRLAAGFAELPATARDSWPAELGTPPSGAVELDVQLDARDGVVEIVELSLVAGEDRDRPRVSLHALGTAPLRLDVGGIASADGAVAGSIDLVLDVPQLGLARASSRLEWTANELSLDDLVIGTPVAGASGRISLGEPGRVLAGEPIAAIPLEGAVVVRLTDATQLPPTWLPPQVLGGALDVVLELAGTLGAVAPSGSATLRDGRLKLAADVPILDRIEAELRIEPTKLDLTRFHGNASIGSVSGRGTLTAAEGTTLLDHPESATLDLTMTAEDALFIRATGKKLRANAAIRVAGGLDRIDVTGNVDIQSGRFVRRISLVPDVSSRGGATTGTGIELFEIPPPLGDAIHFDVAIRTLEPIDVVTHVFNSPLVASLHLRGSGSAPYLDGAISSSSGSLRLPALSLNVKQALVTFAADEPKNPRILLRATTRRHGIDVSMTATGRLSAPEILLSSLPPLTQQELFVLVSTGVLPETLQEQGLSGRASMVGGYVAQEIFDFYFGSDSTEESETFFNRFHFYGGREISRNGVESLVVEFDITDNVALEGERDVYEDYNMGILYRIRF